VPIYHAEGMDLARNFWYFSAMASNAIPTWQLYGEVNAFPDILHVEQVVDRAAGLDWAIGAHRHVHLHQVFLLTSGTINLTIDGDHFTAVLPAVINIPRGTVHSFLFSAVTEGMVVTLPATDFPDIFVAPAETAAVLSRVFITPAEPEICRRFHTLAAAHAGKAAFRRTLLRAEAAALLTQVAEGAQEIGGDLATPDLRIQQLDDLVRASISSRFSLAGLARALSMSPRNLTRLCKAETGMTPQHYIQEQKMREACRLLVYTRMSSQQIAYELGYDDPSYFSRVFKRSLRASPVAYRGRFDG
jgi:AraC family transcriptional regulator, transcriptional activator of pobA